MHLFVTKRSWCHTASVALYAYSLVWKGKILNDSSTLFLTRKLLLLGLDYSGSFLSLKSTVQTTLGNCFIPVKKIIEIVRVKLSNFNLYFKYAFHVSQLFLFI